MTMGLCHHLGTCVANMVGESKNGDTAVPSYKGTNRSIAGEHSATWDRYCRREVPLSNSSQSVVRSQKGG